MTKNFEITANFILEKIDYKPEVGIILGSGLGGLATKIENATIIPYSEIPNFPVSTVEGHSGNLILGTFGGKKVAAMQGRFHFYEGYGMDKVTYPVRVMKFLGIKTLIVSNAAGGLNPKYATGDIMLIKDHINHFPINPLIGKNYDQLGPRFPDMSKVYCKDLIKLAKKIAKKEGIKLRKGIYIGSTGPTLETPAEYNLFRKFGADATGMSTVPEAIVAHHMGIKIFGMSVITNGSAPAKPDGETTHDEVQNVAGKVEPKMTIIIKKLLETIE